MPTVFVIVLILFLGSCDRGSTNREVSADNKEIVDQPEDLPEIEFTKTIYDFGKITEGEIVGTNFSFKNTGNSNLIILQADANCGCTIPEWNKEPIPPGGEGVLEVRFDSSGRTGIQNKSITVYTNGKTANVLLTIMAEVVTK